MKKALLKEFPTDEYGHYQEVIRTPKGSFFRAINYKRTWSSDEGTNKIGKTRVTHLTGQLSSSRRNRAIEMTRKKGSISSRRIKNDAKSDFVSSILKTLRAVGAITFIILCGIYYICGFNWALMNSELWSVNDIESALKHSLIDQEAAIGKLVLNLDWILSTERPTVVVITGPVGVGKTATSTILQETFPWKNRILVHNDGDSQFSAKLVMDSINREPQWTLLVIDDCCKNPKRVLEEVSFVLKYAKMVEAKFLVILIYTHRSDAEVMNFVREAASAKVDYHHVPFGPLSWDGVKQCFMRLLQKKGLPIIDTLVNEMVDSQMVIIDEVKSQPGCKLIDTKVVQYQELMNQRDREL